MTWKDRTVCNWRWWVVLPVVILFGAWALLVFMLSWVSHFLAWAVEQVIYGPAWWDRLMEWVRMGREEEVDEDD